MDNAEIRKQLEPGSGYVDRPGRHVTINQIVAWNVAYWRKAAGLTQEELGERIGWSKVVVSAAERSWDGKRVRQFTADDIMNIAMNLDIPVIALLLPPADDGVDQRYLFHNRDETGICCNMYDLVTYLMPEPAEDDTPVMQQYRERYATTVNFYLGEGQEEVTHYIEELTTQERLVERLMQLRSQYGALREMLSDNDKLQEALGRRLADLRRGRPRQDPRTPEERAYARQMSAAALEMFGHRGMTGPEMQKVMAHLRTKGIEPPKPRLPLAEEGSHEERPQ